MALVSVGILISSAAKHPKETTASNAKANLFMSIFPIGKGGNILTRNSTAATEKVDLLTSKAGRPKIGYF